MKPVYDPWHAVLVDTMCHSRGVQDIGAAVAPPPVHPSWRNYPHNQHNHTKQPTTLPIWQTQNPPQ